MKRIIRPLASATFVKVAAALWLAACSPAFSLTYYLVDDGSWWPADVRARIVAAMDEATAIYNSQADFAVNIRVAWNTGVPTAQSNYNGELTFGGNAGFQTARVAMHESSHYLGTGTTAEWDNKFSGDVWQGAAARHFIKLFDGPGAELRKAGQHYYPYGLNYDNEDSPQNRIREAKLVMAMRLDMGGNDGDGDGMSDEWERLKLGTSSQPAAGDADGDGITNYDEWWTEGDPLRACPVKSGHIYVIRARHSQKVIEAADLTTGANVRQNAYTGAALQKWTATYVGGGYWKFVNVASGKAWDVLNYSWDAGANIIAWNDTGGSNQQWRIVPDGGIYAKLFNRNSNNMVMDVDGGTGATGNGTNISQYFDVLGGANQDWAFDDVTPGEPARPLVAEYKLDGTARDHSGGNLHGIISGGVTFTSGRIDGQAATFNGTNGSIEIPASVDTNFTLACWVKTTATAGGAQWYNGMGLVDSEVGGAAADFGLALVGNKAAFGVGNADITITSSNAINDGSWHHLAATLDTGNGAMRLYVDGALQASGTGPTGARIAPKSLRLGSVAGVTGFFNGSLDEVRLYQTILTTAEISRLAGVGQSLVAGYSFESDAQDSSRQANHGDPVAVAFTAGKVGATAAQFNGTGSFVKIPASVAGDFSVAYWVKTTATGATGQWYSGKAMIDAELPGAVNDWGLALVGNKAGFGIGNPDLTITSTTPINDGAWHHIVATRTLATGAMKLYLDGALQAAATGPTAPRNAPGGLRIGSSLFGGAFFAGAIDDVRIYNYPVSSTQAAALASTLPAPYTSADIGNPGSDGFAGYSAANGGTFTVTGGGTDIASTSDQFQFVSGVASGNRLAVTRVDSIPVNLNGTNAPSARAGLMFRDSTAANSAFVSLLFDQTSGLRFGYRDTAGATAGQVGASVPLSAPFWLRLERNGSTFTAAYATTIGAPASGDWIALGTHTTALIATPLAGLAVTSRVPAQIATATFSNLQIALPTPGEAWRQLYFGLALDTGNGADDADPDQDGLKNVVERALGLHPWFASAGNELPQLSGNATYLTLTYTRSLAATDLQVQAKWSGNLTDWSATDVTDTFLSTDGITELRQAKVPLSTLPPDRGFLRLEVTP